MSGICFIEPLFHATVEGRTNMTRRIMEPQPTDCTLDHPQHPMCLVFNEYDKDDKGVHCPTCGNGICIGDGLSVWRPRYNVGDVVYLKEPYRLESRGAGVYEVYYQFGGAPKLVDTTALGIPVDKITKIIRSQCTSSGYANKLFMPEWAARYFIRINAVRAERLQEISADSCLREGIIEGACSGGKFWTVKERELTIFKSTPQDAYAVLITRINGKGTWDSNPFVWVYEYELCEKSTI